ncbi:MAG: polysaccharide pyruvyl transferase family protein [Methylobacteriaceae bacterium]|nr:polysaccharide pyruvyl transferase family protein [Methylobacteriaceae bacterium]
MAGTLRRAFARPGGGGGPRRPIGSAGHALLVNYTAQSYHFGCFATSLPLYEALIEDGYVVSTMAVEDTHAITLYPKSVEELDGDVFQRFLEANPIWRRALSRADLVVVNGEGTLHGDYNTTRGLLMVAAHAATTLGKRVYIVNHSMFPNDWAEAPPELDAYCRTAASRVTGRVARDAASARIYAAWGVRAAQGFDCSPLFAAARGLTRPAGAEKGMLLLGNGVGWTTHVAEAFARGVRRAAEALPAFPRIGYLTGGLVSPAEDMVFFKAMAPILPEMEIVHPTTAEGWIGAIAGARLTVTGRFHHAMAAMAVGAPFLAIRSHTPKIDGAMELFGLERHTMDSWAPEFEDELATRLGRAFAGDVAVTDAADRERMLELARVNFAWRGAD